MKYLSQITLILAVSFLGELLGYIIPLPIPGSIYGLVLLFILLLTGVIKLSQVKKTGDLLLSLMPIMFVAPGVGLIKKFDACAEFLVPILTTATLSTFVVMAVSGCVADALIKLKNRKEHADNVK